MFKRVNFYLRVYLGFSKREARGFALLIPFLIGFYISPLIYQRIVMGRSPDLYGSMLEAKLPQIYPDSSSIKTNASRVQLTAIADSVPAQRQRKELDYSNLKLDFGEADSVTLQIVPGIGKVMASRIIKFRDGMGGLYSKEQLFDVYGMEEGAYEKIWDFFDFKPQRVNKLHINSLSVEDLAKHPYVSFGQAKVIVAYRDQHGGFSGGEDLLKIKILNPNWVERLKPYLAFD
ncbi:helix-hairpin-helix domain-containing protein [Litoribacter ruber]|uniref:Helix-hairpin-helix domain-containing protein n=1 Tax=Litoribacter ruber TaxID=702568 RepID=A0AAP2G0Q0_9BACT|nr:MULTISPECIES: helix-hairpin-helix domain-containing protein [Litoribacter]MBS9522712.1 helix-hairpin-helix domain-containing protein [Litoribacter alkaliphilus]MBT0811242.1 helix-hairpin-helix domain-containing protein [Litoribacter ruber]